MPDNVSLKGVIIVLEAMANRAVTTRTPKCLQLQLVQSVKGRYIFTVKFMRWWCMLVCPEAYSGGFLVDLARPLHHVQCPVL